MENQLIMILGVILAISIFFNLGPYISDIFHRHGRRYTRSLEEEIEKLRSENMRKESLIRKLKFQAEELRLDIVKLKGDLDRAIDIQKKVSILLYEKSNDRRNNYFKFKHKVEFWMQLQVDGLPIGQPWLFREERFKEVNADNMNKILDQYAKPFLDANLEVWKQVGAEVIRAGLIAAAA